MRGGGYCQCKLWLHTLCMSLFAALHKGLSHQPPLYLQMRFLLSIASLTLCASLRVFERACVQPQDAIASKLHTAAGYPMHKLGLSCTQ